METTQNPMRITYPSKEDLVMLNKVDNGTKHKMAICMIPLNSEKKKKLENEDSIYITVFGEPYAVNSTNVLLYGKVDLNSEDDLNEFENCNFKWTSELGHGGFIPRNYDYETNTGDIIMGGVMQNTRIAATIETFNNLELFKFAHACLGKPNEVIVFRKPVINYERS